MGLEALWSVLVGMVVVMVTAVGGSFAFKLSGSPMTSLGSVWVFAGAALLSLIHI